MPQPEPRRRAMRLAGFDYSAHGGYFVTTCTQNRLALFGSIVGDTMRVNAAGAMIEQWWSKLPGKFPPVGIDEFVVMPNHVHGLLFINGADVAVNEPSEPAGEGGHAGPPLQVSGAPLSRIMQWFKTMTTNAYLAGVRADGWTPVTGKL